MVSMKKKIKSRYRSCAERSYIGGDPLPWERWSGPSPDPLWGLSPVTFRVRLPSYPMAHGVRSFHPLAGHARPAWQVRSRVVDRAIEGRNLRLGLRTALSSRCRWGLGGGSVLATRLPRGRVESDWSALDGDRLRADWASWTRARPSIRKREADCPACRH